MLGGLAMVGRKGSVMDLKEMEKNDQNRTAVRQGRAALTPSHASFTANHGGATASAAAASAGLSPPPRSGMPATRHASSGNISALATPTTNRVKKFFGGAAGTGDAAAAAPPADGGDETKL